MRPDLLILMVVAGILNFVQDEPEMEIRTPADGGTSTNNRPTNGTNQRKIRATNNNDTNTNRGTKKKNKRGK